MIDFLFGEVITELDILPERLRWKKTFLNF